MKRLTDAQRYERKAQLATRAALERMRLTLALHSARTAMMPAGPQAPGSPLRRPLVAVLVGLASRRVGPAKLRRWIRIASFSIAAYRIVDALRR